MYAVCSVALLAAAGLVAGCTSEPEPGPSTSKPLVTTPAPSSPTPTPTTSSPSPSATGMPAAAKVKSEAGAIAFVKYFFDQVNLAWTTPEPDLLRSLSNPDCISCASLTTTASDHVQVTFVLDQKLSNVVDKNGAVVLTDQPKVVERRVELEWVNSQWRVWDIA